MKNVKNLNWKLFENKHNNLSEKPWTTGKQTQKTSRQKKEKPGSMNGKR